MRAYVMDAFADRVFGGNQAGVALPDRPLEDAVMQQIASEFKHSETAFVTVNDDGSVTPRYFTPAGEVDLCGHATVASFALRENLPVLQNRCPVDKHTKREEIKDLIFGLAKDYPDLKERIFGAMQRYPLAAWEPQGRYKRPKDEE